MPEPSDDVDVNAIATPMPGVCVDIKVEAGDSVSAGQVVAVLEAMKMQNNLQAPRSGVVKAVHVNVGDSLEGDTVIIELEVEEPVAEESA